MYDPSNKLWFAATLITYWAAGDEFARGVDEIAGVTADHFFGDDLLITSSIMAYCSSLSVTAGLCCAAMKMESTLLGVPFSNSMMT